MLYSNQPDQYMLDCQFADEHLEEWRTKYANHWVAVYHGEIVAVTESGYDIRDAVLKTVPPSAAQS